MAQGPLLERELPTPVRASALLLPALLCATILALSLARVWERGRRGGPWPARQEAVSLPSPALPPYRLLLFEAVSAQGLARLLDVAWSAPGIEDAVPNLAPLSLPEDMDGLDTGDKKKVFFRAVLPHVLAANRRIRADRAALRDIREHLLRGLALGPQQETALARLAERYRVDRGAGEPGVTGPNDLADALLERVDIIPPSLALAQAAIESGWGGSRFARLGNSLFGQWVFAAEKGIAPLLRAEGADYAVARFVDLAQAVEAYAQNLNTFWAYEEFRALRRAMRERRGQLDPVALAEGLRLYSVRRGEYVEEVRRVMRENRLVRLDSRRLTRVPESAWNEVLARVGEVPALLSVHLPE